ncbi:MAG: LysR family transcriptional regulator [Ezakiella sp.]|nr:LysR family transcriptional regulator [Ezakiella sp.]MDD7761172.1 LysR family transcriptional regulator [Bacillota bacterium]MDY3947331.1 LysR family transcriptional regulator [Ezakiella sp.]
MDIRQLETFIAVSDLKSFSRAGEKLFVTQPTVTNHIKNLENELGVFLVNRMGNAITLTDSGMILYKYARDVVDSINLAKHSIAIHEESIEGVINILSSSVPNCYYLPEKMAEFMKKYDKVIFNVSSNDSLNVINQIKNGKYDFGIVGFQTEENTLVYHKLFSDEIMYIVSKKYFPDLNNYDTIGLNEVLDIPMTLRDARSGTLRTVINQITKQSLHFFKRPFSVCDSNNAIIEIVKNGHGGSFISDLMCDRLGDDVLRLRFKNVDLHRDFYLVYNRLKNLSPVAAEFEKFLLDFDDANK